VNTKEKIIIEGCNTVESLFEQYYVKMRFPGYFGFNWNALIDLLTDLDWSESQYFFINHVGWFSFPMFEQEHYRLVIRDVNERWNARGIAGVIFDSPTFESTLEENDNPN
jgi:hypothetical protein